MAVFSTIDLTVWGFIISSFGTIVGIAGLIVGIAGLVVSIISLYRVGTIKKVVAYNETIDDYNNNRRKILKDIDEFEKKFEKETINPDNEKAFINRDTKLLDDFESIKVNLKKYKSLDEVQAAWSECESIGKLLYDYINKNERELIITKLKNLQVLLNKKGVKIDGK